MSRAAAFALQPKTKLEDRVSFLIFLLNEYAPNVASFYGTDIAPMGRTVSVHLRSKDETDPEVPLVTVVYEITCASNALNPMGSMHGGCIATLYDNFSTYARAALDKYWADFDPEKQTLAEYLPTFSDKIFPDLAMSRMLQVIYHRAVKAGETVFLKVCLESDTKRFATYTAKMYDKEGRVCSFMTHDKVKSGSSPRL